MKQVTVRKAIMIAACPMILAMGCSAGYDPGALPEDVESVEQAIASVNLTGNWGNSRIEQSGDHVTVIMPGRVPAHGRFTGPYAISISFTDDPGCCTGIVSQGGDLIRWSNGTSWVKN